MVTPRSANACLQIGRPAVSHIVAALWNGTSPPSWWGSVTITSAACLAITSGTWCGSHADWLAPIRTRDLARRSREAGDVVHVDRLLDELDADVLEAPQRVDRLEHRPRLVGVDAHGDVVGDLVADRPRDPQVVLELEADLDVDRFEPPRGALGGLRAGGLGLAVIDADEPVEGDVLGVQAAEELVHGAAVRLAADIPQRHLDRRGRAVAEVRVVVPAAI